ncbi:MAG: sulfatase-like hydrolase/transferase [Proteobacteria bacterium]|nr:sulfatase-like hydrolase/transferase [Pseudomonadota bacterium]
MQKGNISTRNLIGKALFGLCRMTVVAAMAMWLPYSGTAADKRGPNIVYILADDAGYGDFGAYGQKEIRTPSIDTMAEEGIVFTNHYAGTTVCAPSRSSLLTGKHTGHTDIRGNVEIIPEGQQPLPPETKTLADVLKEAGMRTGAVGKWGLGGPGSSGVPNKKGFDYWYGYLCQRQAHSYYPSHLWNNGKKVELDGQHYTHDLFTHQALKFIQRNQNDPFFLFLAYTIPHAQLQVPDLEPYQDRNWSGDKKRYAAMITRMDTDIGRLLKLLKELNLDRRTLVMFSSDNGPHAEGGADPTFFDSSGPLRGKKRDLYEGGIRVPMVARWPGTIQAGSRSDHISAFWDVLPTLAELAGAEAPADIDGISMVPTLLGRPENQKKHDYLYWEFHEQGGKQAVRLNDWKGVRLNVRLEPRAPIELYNLKDDVGESRNVAEYHPKIVERMDTIMKEGRTVSSEFPLVGRMDYRFGIYNGWIFSAALLAVGGLLLVSGRSTNRRELYEILRTGRAMERFVLVLSAIATLILYGSSIFLKLWGDTVWFDYGLMVSIVGLAGYGAAQAHFFFRRPGSLMTGGLYRFSRNPKEIFIWVFWTGVAVATVTKPLVWAIVLLFAVRHYVILLEERRCVFKYGNAYLQYRNRVPRYFLFL